jgi:hypothetical protein
MATSLTSSGKPASRGASRLTNARSYKQLDTISKCHKDLIGTSSTKSTLPNSKWNKAKNFQTLNPAHNLTQNNWLRSSASFKEHSLEQQTEEAPYLHSKSYA